jgi:hypothetical protein
MDPDPGGQKHADPDPYPNTNMLLFSCIVFLDSAEKKKKIPLFFYKYNSSPRIIKYYPGPESEKE